MNPKKAQPVPFQKTRFTNLWKDNRTGVYYLFGRFAGKLKKKSLRTTTLSVAKLRHADEAKSERKAATLREVSGTAANFTVAQAASQLLLKLRTSGKKDRTLQFYEERLKALWKLWPGLQELGCAKVTVAACRDWAARYQARVHPNTYNHTAKVLRQVLEIAVTEGQLPLNPARQIPLLRTKAKKPTLPSNEQFQRLLGYLDAMPFDPTRRATLLIRFLAYSGARWNEARHVQWRHVDFAAKSVQICGDPETGTKNWETRGIPMIPELEELLRTERTRRPDETPETPVMLATEAGITLSNACKAIQITRLTHHDLRDLFVTRCIESGVDIPTVAHWTGHKDGGALLMKTYNHLRMEHSLELSQRVTFRPGVLASTAL